MRSGKNPNYFPAEAYNRAAEVLQAVTVIILFSFVKHATEKQDIIIRNFLARGTACLESIFETWKLGNYQDAWILHRTLLDRLFHLRHLSDQGEFEVFDDWSFLRQFEAKNNLVSDPEIMKTLDQVMFKSSSEERIRYNTVRGKGVAWSRPKAEQVAKNMNLQFLYKYGYDYASTHVHPMSNDGEADFLRLTRLSSEPQSDQKVILNNSFLVQLILVQEGLNTSTLRWRAVIYDFLDDCLRFLENGSENYQLTFAKIVSVGADFDWYENSVPPETQ